jgi:hypothetical protein
LANVAQTRCRFALPRCLAANVKRRAQLQEFLFACAVIPPGDRTRLPGLARRFHEVLLRLRSCGEAVV